MQDLEISRDEVKKAQAEDKFCQSLKPGPASGKTEYFRDEVGLIFRRRKNGEHQLVVPLSLARRIVAANHSPVSSASRKGSNPGHLVPAYLLARNARSCRGLREKLS